MYYPIPPCCNCAKMIQEVFTFEILNYLEHRKILPAGSLNVTSCKTRGYFLNYFLVLDILFEIFPPYSWLSI
jgi:hypothetical protein